MLTSAEAVRAFIKENGPLWKISLPASGDEKNNRSVFQFSNINEGGINESISKFNSVLPYLNGKYLIVSSTSRLEGNGLAREFFEIWNHNLQPNPTAQGPANIAGIGDIGALVEEKVQQRLNEMKLNELQKENETLKAQINGPTVIDKIFEAILPYKDLLIPAVVGMITKKPMAPVKQVAGIEKIQETETETETENEFNENDMKEIDERINVALSKIAAVDDKIHIHLEKLAEIAEKNPKQFKMLLKMLENF